MSNTVLKYLIKIEYILSKRQHMCIVNVYITYTYLPQKGNGVYKSLQSKNGKWKQCKSLAPNENTKCIDVSVSDCYVVDTL